MKDTDKVTLTFGQLKRLVKESYSDPSYMWVIIEQDNGNKVVEKSDIYFDTPEEAWEDGQKHFELYDEKLYSLDVWDDSYDTMNVNKQIHRTRRIH